MTAYKPSLGHRGLLPPSRSSDAQRAGQHGIARTDGAKPPANSATRERIGGKRRSWTEREKVIIARRLRRLYRFSPYIVALLVPGGLALLPLIAWWRHSANRSRPRQ
jgi:hypothetical protein